MLLQEFGFLVLIRTITRNFLIPGCKMSALPNKFSIISLKQLMRPLPPLPSRVLAELKHCAHAYQLGFSKRQILHIEVSL